MNLSTTILVAGSLAALAAPSFAQAVLQVDETGAGGAFLEIQDAVDAAAPGDLVLVETGTYSGFTVAGKGLTIAADSGAVVEVDSNVVVQGVPLGSELVLSGLSVFAPRGFVLFPLEALSVSNCAGHVLVQDMGFESEPGVGVRSSAAVSIVSSTLLATGGSGSGVFVDGSNVFLHDSSIQGGAGGADPAHGAHDGGPGISMVGTSTALVVGCDVTGGMGGPGGVFNPSAPGGEGGPAVRMTGNPGIDPTMVTYASTFVGGPGGTAPIPANVGAQGPVYFGVPGLMTTLPNAERQILLDPVVRDGELTSLGFVGEPFDFTWHVIALQADDAVVYLPEVLGAIHPGGLPFFFKFRGLLNASGQKVLNVTLGATGLDYVPVYEQALMYNATEGFVASNPRMVAFLDSNVP